MRGARGDEGQSEPEKAAGEREEQSFDKALTDDTGAAGAEGEAGGDFAQACGGAREEEVGEIGAGDEQDESDDGHEDLERIAVFAAYGHDAVGGGG